MCCHIMSHTQNNSVVVTHHQALYNPKNNHTRILILSYFITHFDYITFLHEFIRLI